MSGALADLSERATSAPAGALATVTGTVSILPRLLLGDRHIESICSVYTRTMWSIVSVPRSSRSQVVYYLGPFCTAFHQSMLNDRRHGYLESTRAIHWTRACNRVQPCTPFFLWQFTWASFLAAAVVFFGCLPIQDKNSLQSSWALRNLHILSKANLLGHRGQLLSGTQIPLPDVGPMQDINFAPLFGGFCQVPGGNDAGAGKNACATAGRRCSKSM